MFENVQNAQRMLDVEALGSVPGRTNMGIKLFEIGCGLYVLDSAPE